MLHILLPVHNRKMITLSFIECLLKQTFTDYHLVLIDDGSTDGTSREVKLKIPQTTVIRGDGELWWAGALEMGIRSVFQSYSNEDSILIINDDVIIEENYLQNMINHLNKHPASLVFSKAKSLQTNEIAEIGVYYNERTLSFENTEDESKINTLSTRGLIGKVSTYKKAGYFYPILIPHYLSDYEYTLRAHQKGINLKLVEFSGLHINDLTTGVHAIPDNIEKYVRNIMSKRNASYPLAWFFFAVLRNTKYLNKLRGIKIICRRNRIFLQEALKKDICSFFSAH